jgi:RNA polymerase-associated protein
MTTQSKLFLHDHPLSSYAQKIRIALREKKLPFTAQTPTGIGSGSDTSLSKVNPRNEVPALVDDELKIFDSTVILAYLEEAYPEIKLLPDSPAARAKARMIEEVCDTHYEAINWAFGEIIWMKRAGGELASHLTSQIRAQAGWIQAWLSEQLGEQEYFNGNTFGYADICVAPIYNRAAVNGYGEPEGSKLWKWLERVKSRETVKDTFAEFEESARKMPGFGKRFLSGEIKREYRDHRLEFLVKSGGIEVILEGLKKDNIRFSWPEPAKL